MDFYEPVLPTPIDFATAQSLQFGMRHRFWRRACNDQCGALQLIQTTFGTVNIHHVVGLQMGGYYSFVDAGPNSPNRVQAGKWLGHPTRPYFYPPFIHRWEAGAPWIDLVDVVGGAAGQDETYMEAAAVCIGHHGGNQDVVMEAILFGWRDFGGIRTPGPGGPAGVTAVTSGSVSDMFKAIVAAEYGPYAATDIVW